MTDTGKFWAYLTIGIVVAVASGLITGQLFVPILFGVYAVVNAIMCITVESIAKKAWTALIVGAVLVVIFYIWLDNQLAWILFTCGAVVFTFITLLKESKNRD